MPAFVSAIQGLRNQLAPETLLKEVVSEVHSIAGLSQNLIQRARNIVKDKVMNENVESYKNIPSLCQEIIKSNPGTQICCQVDSEGRFYRLFMLLPSLLIALNACIPCLEIDGTFMKHHMHNGVCFMVVSKTGNHKNVPIAFGMFPSETNTIPKMWQLLLQKTLNPQMTKN
jgi:zinc finger SWIM domain-containing protein 3